MRNLYAKRIFPRLLDRLLGNAAIGLLRRESLLPAAGRTIEIGFGTGLNLPHFPPTVTSLTVIDPELMLDQIVSARIAASPIPVTRMRLDAQNRLPFPDQSFDCAVTTFTLCSIGDVAAALAEIRRVLSPGGSFIFLEHGRSNLREISVWQDRLNPIQKVVGVGCNMNRQIDQIIEDAGFHITHLDRFQLPHTPRLLGEIYRGVAR